MGRMNCSSVLAHPRAGERFFVTKTNVVVRPCWQLKIFVGQFLLSSTFLLRENAFLDLEHQVCLNPDW